MRIGIVAPSARIDEAVAGRVAAVAAARYGDAAPELVFHPQCYLSSGHFAGDDAARAAAFLEVANDPGFDALWFARGGYGACRLAEAVLPKLTEAARAKRYLGYSDAGFLLAGMYAQGFDGLAHGPMASDVRRAGGEAAVERALDWLVRADPATLEPHVSADTPAAAFNLTILSQLIGTPFQPDLAGHVLMLEETEEQMYRIDRYLFHVTSNPAHPPGRRHPPGPGQRRDRERPRVPAHRGAGDRVLVREGRHPLSRPGRHRPRPGQQDRAVRCPYAGVAAGRADCPGRKFRRDFNRSVTEFDLAREASRQRPVLRQPGKRPRRMESLYRIAIEPVEGRVRASVAGQLVADSARAMVLHESYRPDTYYFPKDDLAEGLLKPSDFRTFCPFKGTAHYWNLGVAGDAVDNGAWSYEAPLPEAREIGGMICFDGGVVDELSADPPLSPRNIELVGGSSVLDWLIKGAWLCKTPAELTERFAQHLVAAGVPLWRFMVNIWTLHPELAGQRFSWSRDGSGVVESDTPHGLLSSPGYLNSPVRYVSEGLGGVRQRLDVDDPEFTFPILDELRSQGGTDYVAIPLPFSDGRFQTMTMATDHPDGFSTAQLGEAFQAFTILGRFFEAMTLRRNTAVLFDTYLGERTRGNVLGGLIQRGDGEEIRAAILYCDMREFDGAVGDPVPRRVSPTPERLLRACRRPRPGARRRGAEVHRRRRPRHLPGRGR